MKRLATAVLLLGVVAGCEQSSLKDRLDYEQVKQALDSAQYNFESTTQSFSASGKMTAVATSTTQVFAGNQSLAVTFNNASGSNSGQVALFTNPPNLGSKAVSVTNHFWIPAACSGKIGGVQCFAQKAASPWTWYSGGYLSGTSLAYGSWNTCTIPVAGNAGALQSLCGLQVDFTGACSGVLYVDSCGWPTATDGGTDAGVDAGVDAGTDAGSDAGGADAGDDSGTDAGLDDAGADAGFDAGIDAGMDAGFDAGVDAGVDAGYPTAVNTYGWSSGCGLAATSGQSSHSMVVDGVTRTFVMQVPQSYNPNRAYPEIFVFHGAGGSSSSSIAMNLQGASGADNAIYLFGDGIDFKEYGVDYGIGWNDACQSYDMDFIAQMSAFAESNLCINTTNRFATGYSWGADLTNALVCCMGSSFAAVAPSSGDEMNYNPGPLSDGTGSGLNCAVSTRPGWRLTYGSGDSNTHGGDGAYTLAQFKAEVAYMMTAESCLSSATPLDAPCASNNDGGACCYAYNNCAKDVIECNYPGLGHNLPNGWAQATWNFFSRYMPKVIPQ